MGWMIEPGRDRICLDYDLYVGQRPRHDRPGAYGQPANESVPLAQTRVVPN